VKKIKKRQNYKCQNRKKYLPKIARKCKTGKVVEMFLGKLFLWPVESDE